MSIITKMNWWKQFDDFMLLVSPSVENRVKHEAAKISKQLVHIVFLNIKINF